MRRIRVYPYKQGSKSAKALATALGGKVLKLVGSGFTPRAADIIINWGSSGCPIYNPARVLNHPSAIAAAANKLQAFEAFRAANVSCPAFASAPAAVDWGGPTVVRHKLTGHSGEGIEIVEPGNPLPAAPLYVQYIKKQEEYRVHVIGGSIIIVQRKARRLEVPDAEVNWQVRNHHNGFVFVRQAEGGNPVNAPQQVLEQANAAIGALGLDFGAVDVIWNAHEQRAYVLEVNTAPGMEGSTANDYANGIRSYLGE